MLGRGHARREGNQNLGRHGQEANAEGRDQEYSCVGRKARRQHRHRGQTQAMADQPPALEQITEGDHQHQPEPIPNLGQCHRQGGRPAVQAEFRSDQTDQRLGVVEVGDGQSAGDRHQQDRRPRGAGRLRAFAHWLRSARPAARTDRRTSAWACGRPDTPAVRR